MKVKYFNQCYILLRPCIQSADHLLILNVKEIYGYNETSKPPKIKDIIR